MVIKLLYNTYCSSGGTCVIVIITVNSFGIGIARCLVDYVSHFHEGARYLQYKVRVLTLKRTLKNEPVRKETYRSNMYCTVLEKSNLKEATILYKKYSSTVQYSTIKETEVYYTSNSSQ